MRKVGQKTSHPAYKTLTRSRCSLFAIINEVSNSIFANILDQDGAKMVAVRVDTKPADAIP
jgi:hypothetical protein